MKERGNQGQWWSSYNIKLKPWEINECYFTLYNILCLLKVTQSRGEKTVEMLTFLLYTAIIYFSKSYSIT